MTAGLSHMICAGTLKQSFGPQLFTVLVISYSIFLVGFRKRRTSYASIVPDGEGIAPV